VKIRQRRTRLAPKRRDTTKDDLQGDGGSELSFLSTEFGGSAVPDCRRLVRRFFLSLREYTEVGEDVPSGEKTTLVLWKYSSIRPTSECGSR
jgi:hypothetical protein